MVNPPNHYASDVSDGIKGVLNWHPRLLLYFVQRSSRTVKCGFLINWPGPLNTCLSPALCAATRHPEIPAWFWFLFRTKRNAKLFSVRRKGNKQKRFANEGEARRGWREMGLSSVLWVFCDGGGEYSQGLVGTMCKVNYLVPLPPPGWGHCLAKWANKVDTKQIIAVKITRAKNRKKKETTRLNKNGNKKCLLSCSAGKCDNENRCGRWYFFRSGTCRLLAYRLINCLTCKGRIHNCTRDW